MFDHVGIVVANLARARAFYDAVMPTLGLSLLQDNSTEGEEGWLVYGTEPGQPFFVVSCGRPSFWTADHTPARSPVHLAFSAPSRTAIGAFHKAGLAAGGKENGPPGDRGNGYYAAYLVDPDGNNVEAGYR